LEIASQPEPWSDVKVVKRFELVLHSQTPPRLSEQIDVILENAAKVGVGVCDAELVPWPAFE
jgi:hypothetical protein